MTMSDGQGNNIVVSVPVTFIAIDLTTQATKQGIVSSPLFRRMVARGLLTIISDDAANAMMADPAAQKEADRLYSRAQELTPDIAGMPQEAARARAEGDGSVSGFAMNIAMAKDLDEDQVMTTLRNNESTLTNDDWSYIAQNSQHGRVKSYAATKLV
jgi:acyl-coenzyme A synthetase/AMP-(fatty) acid ligase